MSTRKRHISILFAVLVDRAGKTVFAKKVYTSLSCIFHVTVYYVNKHNNFCCTLYQIVSFTRSLGKIIKGCAATALAAQCYGDLDFDTSHGLFLIPVVENEEDYDHIDSIWCDKQR